MLLQVQGSMKTSKLVRCAVFACMALVIFAVESLIPPFLPIPGFKLGLANVVTLAAVYVLGSVEALWILVVRIILGNMFTGQLTSFIYSFAGGVLCYLVTIALKRFFKGNTIWALGVIGAIFHNIGQIICASFMFRSTSLVYYGVILCFVSCITGTFTGLCAQYMIKQIGEKI